MSSGKAIGENENKPKKRRKKSETVQYVTVEQFKKVMAVIDEKFAALWNECLDIRMGEQITNDSALIEDEQDIE